jgi:hypothetical protein
MTPSFQKSSGEARSRHALTGGGAGFWLDQAPTRSPDEAQRNPGSLDASILLPDFTPFHPGYETKKLKASGTPAGA